MRNIFRGFGAVFGDFLFIRERFFEHAFQNFFHAVGETVGLGHALDLRFAITRAQNGGELAESVNALVVHLDDDDALEVLEDFIEAVRQRMNVAQM